jgi:S1-C subfamily serine protease
LANLKNMLASTSPTIPVPRYESYEYTEVGFRSRASAVGVAEMVDQVTGRTIWSGTIDESVDLQLTLRAGVDDSDESNPPRSDGVAHSVSSLRELLSVEASNELLDSLGDILSNFKLATAQYHRELNPSYAIKRRLEEVLAYRGGLIDGSEVDDGEWLKAIVGMNAMQETKRTPRSARFSADVAPVSTPPSGPGPKHATVASSASIADTIESVQRAVVRIDGFKGLGSGLFIIPGDRVLTNAHVVGGISELVVIRTRGGGVHVGQVVASDTSRDLALLSAGVSRTFIELGHDDAVRIGQEVIALGSPAGLSFSATRGIVSQLRQAGETRLIQHDAAINPGSSGGPLLDREGKALGINTIKLTESEGLGFAVTSGEIQEFLLAIPAASQARSAGPEEGLE